VIRSYSLNAWAACGVKGGSRLSSGVDSGVLASTPEFAREPSREAWVETRHVSIELLSTLVLSFVISHRGRIYVEYTH
jgi:hypothetical protein